MNKRRYPVPVAEVLQDIQKGGAHAGVDHRYRLVSDNEVAGASSIRALASGAVADRRLTDGDAGPRTSSGRRSTARSASSIRVCASALLFASLNLRMTSFKTRSALIDRVVDAVGILEDRLHLAAKFAIPLGGRTSEYIDAFVEHAPRGWLLQAQDNARDRRLAAAAFANQADDRRLRRHAKRYIIHSVRSDCVRRIFDAGSPPASRSGIRRRTRYRISGKRPSAPTLEPATKGHLLAACDQRPWGSADENDSRSDNSRDLALPRAEPSTR